MSSLDESILQAVKGLRGISVFVFFGSRARGDHRPDSDLDVAILPESQDPRTRRYLLCGVAVALADLVPEGWVHVVFLDQIDDVLRMRVMEHGRVLINRNPEAWKELRVRTMREYGDREWVRNLYIEARKQRLLRGELSGGTPKALESLRRIGKWPR
ncbi:MAG TPA: nucleotidyltransferase domain-containing protein [Thermoanaerobaculia bacterium]